MSTITATFTASDGSIETAGPFPVPPITNSQYPAPVFSNSMIVAGGAAPVAPTQYWYVSPLGGSAPNGTRAQPFSAQAVFVGLLGQSYALIATMPTYYNNALKASLKGGSASSPIQPGHGIVLIADPVGTVGGGAVFGNLLLQSYFSDLVAPGLDNGTNFVTISQDPGVTVQSLHFAGASGWFINGLNFVADEGDFPSSSIKAFVIINAVANNIIVANCSFQSRTPFASLTPAQAIASSPLGISIGDGATVNVTNPSPGVLVWTTSTIQNITVASNFLFNVQFGMGAQRANNVRFCYNEICQHLFDGIDWGSNNMEIDHNYIHDRLNAGISYHPDFMQGQPWQVTSTTPWTVDQLSNINIHDNVGVGSTIPGLIWASNTSGNSQGIDYFNGEPQNVTFRNNLVIVTGNTQGLSMYGGNDLTMDHNTVMTSDLSTVQAGVVINTVASPEVPSGTTEMPTNVSITNNLANSIGVCPSPSWLASDNVVIAAAPAVPSGRASISFYAQAVPGSAKTYDVTLGEANPVATISGLIPSQVFTMWDWTNFLFDTTPLPGLPSYMTAGIGAAAWTNMQAPTNWPFK